SINFPGPVYLFWALGKLFGWGKTAPFYAFDASLVVALGALMASWSRRLWERWLPGLVGYTAFLSSYLSFDYALTAQRDWQGPFFAVAGLLAAQAWPGRTGRLALALGMATALTFRPHIVLFLPAAFLVIDEGARRSGDPWSVMLRAVLEW